MEHCGGGGIVAKLVRHAQKQQLLQAYSNRPDAEKTRFDYWALVRIVARRLLRPCSSKSQLRPHRPLYEAFKEAFFHNRTVKRKADQKAWFFAHVRQVLMRLKERYVDITYRPWNDPEIDMGASSEEEEENDAYVVIQPESEHDVSKEVSKSDFWKSEAMGEFVKEPFASGAGTVRTSQKRKKGSDAKDPVPTPVPDKTHTKMLSARVAPSRVSFGKDGVTATATGKESTVPLPSLPPLHPPTPRTPVVLLPLTPKALVSSLVDTPATPSTPSSRGERESEGDESINIEKKARGEWLRPRTIPHSNLVFSGFGLENLTTFPERLKSFEREYATTWNRDCISEAHLYMMDTRWEAWQERTPGEVWKTTSSERFILFLGYVLAHVFPQMAANSSHVDKVTRLCSIIGAKKARVDPMNFVIELQMLGCQIAEKKLIDLDLNEINRNDLERVRFALKTNFMMVGTLLRQSTCGMPS